MIKFTVTEKGEYRNFEFIYYSWQEVLDHFYKHPDDVRYIAHNDNDIFYAYSMNNLEETTVYYINTIYVRDEYNRIINRNEIIEGLETFQPIKEKYSHWKDRWLSKYHFRYRIDPVPHVGNGNWGHYYRHEKKNKRYYAELASVKDIFPSDSRLREQVFRCKGWNDYQRNNTRSWKQKKIKKQWMKNLPKK
jgi:hypothetical protein